MKSHEAKYKDFSRQTGLRTQTERLQMRGFNKSVSQKAVAASKRVEKSIEKNSKSDIIKASRYFNSSEKLYEYAKKVKSIDGFEDVAIHGNEFGFSINDLNGNEVDFYTPKEFADILRADPNYHVGSIRLLSCDTGSKNGYAAQVLANELNVNVLAPDKTLFIDFNGEMFIGTDEYSNDGKWVLFKPKGG